MLTIRPAQMNVLNAVASRKLLADRARAAHAAAAAALGDEGLRLAVDEVVRRCGEYGVETIGDRLRLMDLAMTFGADWQRAELARLDPILRDAAAVPDAALRVRKAWRAALRRLARGD